MTDDHSNRKKYAKTKKLLAVTVLTSALVVNPFSLAVKDGLSPHHILSTNFAVAAGLADVQILSDVSVHAKLDPNTYNLNLGLTGTGLVDAGAASPETAAVFYIPSLKGKLANSGPANVHIEILPITIDDLLALNSSLVDLQDHLTGLMEDFISGVDEVTESTPSGAIEIQGLNELNEAIDNLNKLNGALADLLAYDGQGEAVVNEDGSVFVSFGEGLGNHLETVVQENIQTAANDVSEAVNTLEIKLLDDVYGADDLLDELTNELLLSFVGNVTAQLTGFTNTLTDGTIDIANDLASVQVIGNTTIDLPVKVEKPANVNGEVPVYGAGVQPSAIDAQLLSDLTDSAAIEFNELDETDNNENGSHSGQESEDNSDKGEADSGNKDSEEVNDNQDDEDEIDSENNQESEDESAEDGGEKETTAPDHPEVSSIIEGQTIVKGKGFIGATVYAEVAGEVIGKVKVENPISSMKREVTENNGLFTMELREALPADTTIEFYQVWDEKKSAAKAVKVQSMEGIEIQTPIVDPAYAGQTAISGTAQEGAVVQALINGESIGETTVENVNNPNGYNEFSIGLGKPLTVGAMVEVYQIDQDGNPSAPITLMVLPAIGIPEVDPIYEGQEKITGIGQEGMIIKALIAGEVIGEVAIPEGEDPNFTLELEKPPLLAGTAVEVYQADEEGTHGESIFAKVLSPVTAPTVEPLYEEQTTITGTGLEGATVNAVVDGEVIGKTLIPASPNMERESDFIIQLSHPLQSDTTVEIYQTDPNGKDSESIFVTVLPKIFNGHGIGNSGIGDLDSGAGIDIGNGNGSFHSEDILTSSKLNYVNSHVLPNTASPYYNWLIGGLLLLLAGTSGLYIHRRKEK